MQSESNLRKTELQCRVKDNDLHTKLTEFEDSRKFQRSLRVGCKMFKWMGWGESHFSMVGIGQESSLFHIVECFLAQAAALGHL